MVDAGGALNARVVGLVLALGVLPQSASGQVLDWATLLEAGPSVTAVDSEPTPTNRGEVVRAMTERFADQLGTGSGEFESTVWILIEGDGVVRDTRLAAESGSERWDRIAQWMAQRLTFEPAEQNGLATAAWIRLPITGRVR